MIFHASFYLFGLVPKACPFKAFSINATVSVNLIVENRQMILLMICIPKSLGMRNKLLMFRLMIMKLDRSRFQHEFSLRDWLDGLVGKNGPVVWSNHHYIWNEDGRKAQNNLPHDLELISSNWSPIQRQRCMQWWMR